MAKRSLQPSAQDHINLLTKCSTSIRMMCFLQLSARGVPARVILGNSLTLETSEVSHTAWMRNLPTGRREAEEKGDDLAPAA